MIKRYDKTECVSLVADPLYCMVHKPLLSLNPSLTRLNPAEIWMAAKAFTAQLTDCSAPEEVMDLFIEQLEDQADSNKDDAFLIAMVSMCQISALRQSVPNNKLLISRLVDYCCCHTMYNSVFGLFNDKEQDMQSVNKQVDILHYALPPEQNDQEAFRTAVKQIAETARALSLETIRELLITLNLYNLQHGHFLDDLILELYECYSEKTTPQAGIEFTVTKNVAEKGGNQLNVQPTQVADIQQLVHQFSNLALHGKR